MIGQEVRSWSRNESREARDEIERIEDDGAGAVLPVTPQDIDHASVLGQRETLARDRRTGEVAGEALAPGVIVGLGHLGVQATARAYGGVIRYSVGAPGSSRKGTRVKPSARYASSLSPNTKARPAAMLCARSDSEAKARRKGAGRCSTSS